MEGLAHSYIKDNNTAYLYTQENDTLDTSGEYDDGIPLPVKVAHFQASSKENTVALQWTTTSEINFDYFEVLRSVNKSKFEPVGTIAGQGTSKERNDYKFTDTQQTKGNIIYELVAVDLDGSKESLGFASTYILPAKNISFFPNPVSDGQLKVTSPETAEAGLLTIYSLKGEKMYETTLEYNTQKIDLPDHLTAGVYSLRIIRGYDQLFERLVISD